MLNYSLSLIFKLRPKDLSIILFYGKLWDAITDPLIGFVVSKTNTKFGKLRPWYARIYLKIYIMYLIYYICY